MDSDWFSHWVNDLQLPGSPWYEVNELLADTLAYRIRLEGLTYDQLMKVSKFVGMRFMKKYHLYDLYDSFSPSTVKSSRLTTDAEVQDFLKDMTLKSAESCGCNVPVDSSTNKSFIEMLELVKAIFQTKIGELQVASTGSDAVKQKRNALGQTLIKLLKSDPKSLGQVAFRLRGQPMPQCLRHYLYRLLILRRSKKTLANSILSVAEAESSLTKLRAKFASNVRDGMQKLKIKKPTETSLTKLIRSSVKTAFETSSGLNAQAKDMVLQQECGKVLNILYTRRKQFEYAYSLWLVPLLHTFREYETKDWEYEIAMWLDALIDHCVLSISFVHQTAFASWQNALKHSSNVLAFQDNDLKMVFQTLDIATDEKAVKEILQKASQTDLSTRPYSSLHVILLIRQWILHLFVGSFDLSCTLFFWDQLFLNDWSKDCFVRVCLVLIYSLADAISKCKTKVELLDLFCKNSSALQLRDVCHHWKKLDELLDA